MRCIGSTGSLTCGRISWRTSVELTTRNREFTSMCMLDPCLRITSEQHWVKIRNHDKRDKVSGPSELKGLYAISHTGYRQAMDKVHADGSQVHATGWGLADYFITGHPACSFQRSCQQQLTVECQAGNPKGEEEEGCSSKKSCESPQTAQGAHALSVWL
jgi:hypothetical protein